MRIKSIAIATAAVAALAGCDYQAAASGVQGVVQQGSFTGTADKTLIDCIKPAETKNELNNSVFWYPAHQISWSATSDPGSERGPYDVVSSAEAPADVLVPLTVTFDLTQDCNLLKQFHAKIGTKYNGWVNEDGSESDGWKQLVNYVVGQPLQNTLNTVSQNYTWQQIWNDEKVRREFTEALDKDLPAASKARTEGVEYFTNFQISVYKPTPANSALKAAIELKQANIQAAQAEQAKGVAEAQAAQAKAEAQLSQAKAETATAQQEALRQEAEISGFGNVEEYNKWLAVTKGINPYQPTYVLPQNR